MKNKNWPLWIPYPGSWMNAIFLTLLTGTMGFVVKMTWQMGYFVANFSPKLSVFFGLLALLSPIIIISFAHHWLQIFIDKFFPDPQSTRNKKSTDFIPNIMSWWEGLYGWLVIILSTLISMGVLGTFFYNPSVNFIYYMYMFSSWDKTQYLLTIPTIVWVVVAAYLYYFEALVRHHIIASNTQSSP